MLGTATIVIVAIAYLGLLFAIAWYGDRRADAGPEPDPLAGRSIPSRWQSTARRGPSTARSARRRSAASSSSPSTPGPTIVFLGWWFLLRKIARISKSQRITSIADFIASRYGKSASLGMIVTVIAMIGTMPYIALQLKAVSTSFTVLVSYNSFADLGHRIAPARPRLSSPMPPS